jgi:heterodisulfide reductase subunit D
MQAQKPWFQHIRDKGNIYNEPREKRFSWLRERPRAESGFVYFVGCTTAYRVPKMAESTHKILKAILYDFAVLPDEWCCGHPLLMTGQKKAALEVVHRNIAEIEAARARTLVTSCPGCAKMFKVEYPKLTGKRLPFEVMHITELMEKYDSKLRFSERVSKKVTYHDPCHLGRGLGVFNPPRKILENIPGIELVEMERIGRGAACCGAGGGVMASFPAMAQHAAKARIREAVEFATAQTIVSACPFCYVNLSRTAEATRSPVEVKDVTEIAAEALR